MCHHESGASPPRCNCLNMHLPGVLDLGGPSVPGHGPFFSYICDLPILGLKSQVLENKGPCNGTEGPPRSRTPGKCKFKQLHFGEAPDSW